MDIIRAAIERPIAVVAVVLMAIMFGVVALSTIPIQLIPDVRKPVIEIRTNWPGAAPAEVEREIINPQEDELKGIEGLETMTSRSLTGSGRITLEFAIGTNMDRSLLLVANRLDRVSGYPDEADEPTLETSGSDDNPIAWFIVKRLDGNTRPIEEFGDFVEDVVQERFERVEGVSGVNVFGGASQELQIVIRPESLARYGLTIPDVVNRLRRESISLSAGDIEEGKRRYVVRAEGELNTIEAIESVVLSSEAGAGANRFGRVLVGDIANVSFGYSKPTARIRNLGDPAIAVNAVRETGANVIETMEGLRAAVTELEETSLRDAGLYITQVYDETIYIDGAIELVVQNIWIGGLLAAFILMVFLRSPRATLVVSLAIPVSVVASFVAMAALGRTLNVISLAGIAFAVGMVVDAAIVVLENIYRLRQEGKSAKEAAYLGASQVWGAILVSALTTVMVFIPILIMELEAGQLFRDIAVAISVSVMLSLLVAITVIPALTKALFGGKATLKPIRLPVIDWLAGGFKSFIVGYAKLANRQPALGLLFVLVISGGAVWAAWQNVPEQEYLPDGNRNLVFGVLIPPPGYNLDTTTTIAERIERTARPLWEKDVDDPEGPPAINSFFFVALTGNSFVGASAKDGTRVNELIPVLSRPIFAEPGTFGFMSQRSLFGRGIGGGKVIELNISGPELDQILGVALQAAGKVGQILPRSEGNQFRPLPGLELGAPEVRLSPNRIRLADAGVDARTLASTVDAYNDGLRISEVTVGGERIDLMLKGPTSAGTARTQDINSYPVVTASGQILPVSALADVLITAGPTEIRHRERVRTVTLEIKPNDAIPLETAINMVKESVVAELEQAGLPPGVSFSLSGTADKLTQTQEAIQFNLLIALVIVYLVMAILFESFVLPFVILLSVPVAAAGGVAGLWAVNQYQTQPLDMLTMLGFVILIGIVVNNAILIVHQTLLHRSQDGMSAQEAIVEATRNRIRPIFMSTLTSVFGMLPLVLFPGAGSELYRGLGSVVVGGLAMSAVLTLLIVPPLLRLCLWERQPDPRASFPKPPSTQVPEAAE
ncbi:MAG: efflux RND transporter permease subunit [Pseudomonadota bacterium]